MTAAAPAPAFIHPRAICDATDVGAGTRIWAFAHVLAGARIGQDCNICDGVFIESEVKIGDRVTVKCGVQLWDGVRLEDDVYVGPNATFTNDRFPRSKIYPRHYAETVVRRRASVGANATILPGLEIGEGAMVGAGAVVTQSVPANAIVMGNPARITGYVDADELPVEMAMPEPPDRADKIRATAFGIGAATLHALQHVEDMRGSLAAMEFARDLPFVPQRCFFVSGVPSRDVRGGRAHKTCHQLLVCVAGSVSILLDDGERRRHTRLDRGDIGLYVPPMVWETHHQYAPNAVLMVLASHPYDPSDYIRTYRDYVGALAR
jgi:acetyltransferase-like isoleucine patch superfamily enzyme/dTDP-4-dehydrorhamnose 3,5-epimerase-like enzyme